MNSKGFVKLIPLLFSSAFLLLVSVFVRQNQPETASQNLRDASLKGMIFTSGIQAGQFDIESKYQIVKYPGSENDWPSGVEGYFLDDNDTAGDYLGKCVRIKGEVAEGWQNVDQANGFTIDGKYTFRRSLLELSELTQANLQDCLSDYDNTQGIPSGLDERTEIIGTIKIGERPAPDISYDYRIIPDSPFYDISMATGNDEVVDFVDIVPGTDEMELAFLINLGKKFKITGAMVWGYAESRYLIVTDQQLIE